MASSLGRLDLTEAMVDAGVDLSPAHINVGFISPLMPAVEFQNESMVRYLLDKGQISIIKPSVKAATATL